MRILVTLTSLLLCVGSLSAADDQFQPLFNGKNLDGWVRVNTAESTWTVKDGLLVCSGKPIGELRTQRMFQNFILEVEWRHMKPKGNAGIFVWADDITARGVPFHRSIEVQVLENAYGNNRSHTTHGDIFPIHGAKMTPFNGRGGSRAFPIENRSKPSPEWNHYRIVCSDGEISLAVNGKVVTRGKDCSPRKGYICIESEGGIVHYRNMRIQELPDSPVDDEHVAIADRGYRCLYDGIDLQGWTANEGWLPSDWILKYDRSGPGTLTSEEAYGDVGFIFDVRFGAAASPVEFQIGDARVRIDSEAAQVARHLRNRGEWNRFEGVVRKGGLSLSVNGNPLTVTSPAEAVSQGPLRFRTTGPIELANIYVRDLE